jgi:MFS family permease
MSALTFFIFVVATAWWQLLPVSLVLATSWSALWVGSLMEIMEQNVERATATGLLHTAQYFSNVVGPFVGGVVAHFFGFAGTLLFAGGLAVLALGLYHANKVRERRGVVPG